MKYYALFYDVVEDFLERRMPHREPHLKLVRAAHERGCGMVLVDHRVAV